jgi:hypothetical protein
MPRHTATASRSPPPAHVVDSFVRYEDFPASHIHIELCKLLRLSLNDEGYFFNDRTAPWRSNAMLHAYRAKIKDLVSPWINPAHWEG